MLAFQLVNMLVTLAPGVVKFIVLACTWAWRKYSPRPSDKFAAIVFEVMRKDPHIQARKFADRWLLK
jgi:hypothetical protein